MPSSADAIHFDRKPQFYTRRSLPSDNQNLLNIPQTYGLARPLLLTLLLTQPTGHNRQFHRHFAIKLPSATHLALLQLTRVPVRMPNRHRLPERCGAVMCGVWCAGSHYCCCRCGQPAFGCVVRIANCNQSGRHDFGRYVLSVALLTQGCCVEYATVCNSNSPSPPEVLVFCVL